MMSDESNQVAAPETPQVVPVISNGHTADGRRRLCFGQWVAEEGAAATGDAVPRSTILEDLAAERLCAGEMGHLRWLLERAATHGQVEIEEGRRVMVNAVESVSVRLGVLVVRLRADAGQNHERVESCEDAERLQAAMRDGVWSARNFASAYGADGGEVSGEEVYRMKLRLRELTGSVVRDRQGRWRRLVSWNTAHSRVWQWRLVEDAEGGSPSPSGADRPVVGLDEALRQVGATEAMPGLLLTDGEMVDDVPVAG